MAALGWNEIQKKAIKFVHEWYGVTNERAEAQSFLNEFLNVFGVSRKKVAFFENPIEKTNGHKGFIDMLWKGKILVEMKSKGKNLENAYNQAFDYVIKLKDYEIPEYIMICDFENIHLYNLDTKKIWKFKLKELPKKIRLFGFLAGYNETNYTELLPLNQKAAEQMALLHDELKSIGYEGHNLEVYLVRLLFCLFAENTALFKPRQFYEYIIESREDGKDLAQRLAELFEVLNTPVEKRLKTLDEDLLEFPYVNGKLFEEVLPIAGFNSQMRERLINSCLKDWSAISPAIFGSMFQYIMNTGERRNLGAHYTSEENIMKVIKPLFLDNLWTRFEKIKNNKKQLELFHEELSQLTFLDPACGCGNFLIITYRELRRLELKILQLLYNPNEKIIVNFIRKLNVSQFYGIEHEEFPAQIAKVAMWLIDHQMNLELSNVFGEYVDDLPLIKYANIICENALTYDWELLIPNQKISYIIGNPPFVGKKYQNTQQRKDMYKVCSKIKKYKTLDYVCAWYIKAAEYIIGSKTEVSFVSTNSICQGEQVDILWSHLFDIYDIKINFAHRTFKWNNDASGKANVYCIIIGFSNFDRKNKNIYQYDTPVSEPNILKADMINAYLIDSQNIMIKSRKKSICNVKKMIAGNKPVDYNHLKLSKDDFICFKKREPKSLKYIKHMVGADEFINNIERYCLWLKDCPPSELRRMPMVMDRVNKCREARLKSVDVGAQKLALTPTLFREQLNPSNYLIIPCVSSEKREYIPIGFLNEEYIPVMGTLIIPDASLFDFGILTSKMHMTWVKYICGRLESRYRYSKDIVYNNFPWCSVEEEERIEIEKYAKGVLDIRALYNDNSLADLYDPLAMPPKLLKAHQKLDKAVDKAYSVAKLKTDSDRMKLLFEMYEKIVDNNEKSKLKTAKA
ncbi:TPA: class I SAM-dependent DNA methyltransferase [Clostridioides difficile]|nr:class I SAM-dependent DNA methyltransferase [Clostridioides difficile]MBH7250135.1 class I SAM-dependent DNA methyltransferase [Clostridioides difficile]MBH7461007.1 class I SAM-dependent DNA methyltransferase [Clostridioides difficile]MBY2557962.1 N-6 DNA methylase [Clostridioides difficile]MCK1917658.1 N-6 DNA methylase [Clostridioides difficile]